MVLRLNYNIGTHQCTNRSDSAMSIMMLSTGRFPCDKSGLIRSAFAAETDDRSSELSSASVCECILLAVFCCDIYMPDHAPCVYSTNGGGGGEFASRKFHFHYRYISAVLIENVFKLLCKMQSKYSFSSTILILLLPLF